MASLWEIFLEASVTENCANHNRRRRWRWNLLPMVSHWRVNKCETENEYYGKPRHSESDYSLVYFYMGKCIIFWLLYSLWTHPLCISSCLRYINDPPWLPIYGVHAEASQLQTTSSECRLIFSPPNTQKRRKLRNGEIMKRESLS